MVAAIVISEERDLDPTIQTPTIVLAATIGIQIVLARMQVVVTQQAVTHVLLVMAQANRPVLCQEARAVLEVVSAVAVTTMGKLLRLEGSVEGYKPGGYVPTTRAQRSGGRRKFASAGAREF